MAWNEPGPGRDPWNAPPGGNRGGDKPPDVDLVLKRLRAWFGGGGGGGPRGGQQNGILLIALFALAAWLGSGLYSVDLQERGVVMRFGAYVATTDPGVHWHLPWPIEHVERVTVTRARSVTNRATLLTRDENLVDVELSVQYRVSSARDFLFSVADPDGALQKTANSALREVVGASDMDDLLHGDGSRPAAADTIKRRLQDRLDRYHSGLLVTDVSLQDVKPPDAVKSAFDDATKAHEDQQRLRNDAQAYSDDRLPRAHAEAARELADAQAYRAKTIARAEGDAARFDALLQEYHRAPEITRERLYLDAMSEVLQRTGKVLVDVDKGNTTINLPLEQLLKAAGKAGAAGSGGDNADDGTASSTPRAQAAPPAAGNDSYRSRDRESH